MTPEREKMIREAWALIAKDPVAVREVYDGRAREATLTPRMRVGEFRKPMTAETSFERIRFTGKLRETTWSVECEGLEVVTYRRDRI